MFSQAMLNRSYKVVLIIAAVVGPWTPCGFLEGRPFYFLKRALCTKRLPAPVPNTSSEARSPLCPLSLTPPLLLQGLTKTSALNNEKRLNNRNRQQLKVTALLSNEQQL